VSSGPVRLGTERLVLTSPWPATDAAAVVAFQRRNRAHFAPWDPTRTDAFFAEPYWRAQLESDVEALAQGRRARFFVTERDAPGRIVGYLHFSNVVRGAFQSCHLGFGVDASLEGRSVMREALERGCRWAFEDFGLHRIEANHRPENVRSGRLLRRLGFVPQGYARDYLRIDGQWRDHVLTALVNDAWAPE